MNNLQEKLFEMFCWFHNFCEENHLRYYMLGGTMLGAVRHQGFIPWDDDIDVGMPREDYEKLESLMEGKKFGHYLLETPNTAAGDYFYPFTKVYDTRTTLIENTRVKIKRGIYLDVFPLDGIGETRQDARKNYRSVSLFQVFLLTRVGGIRKGRKWYKNLAVLLARALPSAILDDKKLLHNLVEECKKNDFETNAWCGNLVGAWKARELMPREVFGKPKLYSFEEKQFYGPEQADDYLSMLYGDWKRLPPEDKRVSHHDYIYLDLMSPYVTDKT